MERYDKCTLCEKNIEEDSVYALECNCMVCANCVRIHSSYVVNESVIKANKVEKIKFDCPACRKEVTKATLRSVYKSNIEFFNLLKCLTSKSINKKGDDGLFLSCVFCQSLVPKKDAKPEGCGHIIRCNKCKE